MEVVKKFLSTIPAVVWVIIAVVVLIGFWWFSDDVGSWWEKRKQAQFDAKQAVYEQQIDDLKKREADLIRRAEIAEAREQARIIEKDMLIADIEKRGINIQKAEDAINNATEEFANDVDYINKVASGEIGKKEACYKQCDEGAALGYPCIPNKATYCEKFKE